MDRRTFLGVLAAGLSPATAKGTAQRAETLPVIGILHPGPAPSSLSVNAIVNGVCEALNLFPSMRWGAEDSIGRYVDFVSVVLGLSLFPIGYWFHARAKCANHEA
jgi:hypothetical protein